MEVSGEVIEVTPLAAENSDIKIGDQVMALVGGGGYAGKMVILLHCVLVKLGFSITICRVLLGSLPGSNEDT